MPERDDARVLSVEQALIDEACVAGLARSIQEAVRAGAEGARCATVAIDLSQAREITPRALAALLELNANSPRTAPRTCLVGLSRTASLLAVQVGLAEQFDIFASRVALDGNVPQAERRNMCALIHEVEGHVGVGALDVAGRPLLVRQLQYLRDLGIEDVFVELAEGPDALERALLLLGSDPLTARVQVIPSASPLGVRELARRAGCAENELFLSLPASLALHAKLDLQVQTPTHYRLQAPPGTHASGVSIALLSRLSAGDHPPSRPTTKAGVFTS